MRSKLVVIDSNNEVMDVVDANIITKKQWKTISGYKTLSKRFIEKYQDKLDWNAISQNSKLSEDFIEKFQDKVDFYAISTKTCEMRYRAPLSEEFIEKFQDKHFNWHHISRYQKLSEEFIEKFLDKLGWEAILQNYRISDAVKRKIKLKFKDKITAIQDEKILNNVDYNTLSEDFIEKYQDRLDWKYISKNSKLSEAFIEKFKDKVNWIYISYNQILSEAFIEKFQDKVNWLNISKRQILSEAFIDKYYHAVNWDCISSHQILSEAFIDKYYYAVNWENISIYQRLSDSMIEKYKHNILDIRKNNDPFICVEWLNKANRNVIPIVFFKHFKNIYGTKKITYNEFVNTYKRIGYKRTSYDIYCLYQYILGKHNDKLIFKAK
jgi:hypothetical protein